MNLSQLKCRCCGKMLMAPEFVEAVQQFCDEIEQRVGVQLDITSGYRCPQHNEAVSEDHSSDGPHTIAAIDIGCSGVLAGKILQSVYSRYYPAVFHGIGINQKGNFGGRLIHLDKAPALATRPRPWVWTY